MEVLCFTNEGARSGTTRAENDCIIEFITIKAGKSGVWGDWENNCEDDKEIDSFYP